MKLFLRLLRILLRLYKKQEITIRIKKTMLPNKRKIRKRIKDRKTVFLSKIIVKILKNVLKMLYLIY